MPRKQARNGSLADALVALRGRSMAGALESSLHAFHTEIVDAWLRDDEVRAMFERHALAELEALAAAGKRMVERRSKTTRRKS